MWFTWNELIFHRFWKFNWLFEIGITVKSLFNQSGGKNSHYMNLIVRERSSNFTRYGSFKNYATQNFWRLKFSNPLIRAWMIPTGFMVQSLTLYVPTPQNGQTHSNNTSVTADELFERFWWFCGVMVLWWFSWLSLWKNILFIFFKSFFPNAPFAYLLTTRKTVFYAFRGRVGWGWGLGVGREEKGALETRVIMSINSNLKKNLSQMIFGALHFNVAPPGNYMLKVNNRKL